MAIANLHENIYNTHTHVQGEASEPRKTLEKIDFMKFKDAQICSRVNWKHAGTNDRWNSFNHSYNKMHHPL